MLPPGRSRESAARGQQSGSVSFSIFTWGKSPAGSGYNRSDITQVGGGAGNAVLSDTILFPHSMRATIYQYVKAEAPIDNPAYGQIEPSAFDSFGTPLVEGEYALLGTHDDAEYEMDESTPSICMDLQDGTLAAVGAKLGPSSPPSPVIPSIEYVEDEYRLKQVGYRTTHALRIYDWAVDGGFEYR